MHTERLYVFVDKHRVSHRIGMRTVFTLFDLWTEGNLVLTWEEWDQLIGFLHDWIDRVYNNRHRLQGKPLDRE